MERAESHLYMRYPLEAVVLFLAQGVSGDGGTGPWRRHAAVGRLTVLIVMVVGGMRWVPPRRCCASQSAKYRGLAPGMRWGSNPGCEQQRGA